jgi:hypothetical protein
MLIMAFNVYKTIYSESESKEKSIESEAQLA